VDVELNGDVDVCLQEPTMVVLTFDQVIAESESQLKMHVEIAGELTSGDRETPVKAVVYWLNSYTGYFMAPSALTLLLYFIVLFCFL